MIASEPPIIPQESTAIEVPKVVIEENKPIEIKRVVESNDPTELSEGKPPKSDISVVKTDGEPTKSPRKERKDKGKTRKNIIKPKWGVKHDAIVKRYEKRVMEGKAKEFVVSKHTPDKPKTNLGFKVGISLGVIAGIFGAIFVYNKIRNGYFFKQKVEKQIKDKEESIEEKPISELDRLNGIYGNGAKVDMD